MIHESNVPVVKAPQTIDCWVVIFIKVGEIDFLMASENCGYRVTILLSLNSLKRELSPLILIRLAEYLLCSDKH